MAGASAVITSRASSATPALDTNPTTVAAFVGVTERGPFGSAVEVTSFEEYRKIFGGFSNNSADMDFAVRCYFVEGGKVARVVRVVHCADASDPLTATSATSSLTLFTASPSATQGSVLSAAGPWALADGDTLSVKIDAGSTQTFTIAATQATRESASAGSGFVLANGLTLTFKIDGGSTLTKTFTTSEFSDITLAQASEVVSSLNAFLAAQGAGASASLTNTDRVTITSNRKGTGSGVNITGGTANAGKLAFTTGNVAGTGNVSNALGGVTAAEWVAIMSGLTGAVASSSSGALLLTSSSTGSLSSVQVLSASTADDEMGFDNALHSGIAASPQETLAVVGKTAGTYANVLDIVIAAASNGKTDQFNLSVTRGGIAIERWSNLSMDSTAANYAVSVVNSGYGSQGASDLISLVDLSSTVPSPGNVPATGDAGLLSGGDDGLVSIADADFLGGKSSNGNVGFSCLDEVEDVVLLAIPGRATSAVQNGALSYSETTRGGLIFVILDPPAGQTVAQMRSYVSSTASLQELSEVGAIYYPRILVDNPSTSVFGNDATLVAPPSGAIAGLCARIDNSKQGGAFEHPASIELGFMRSARGIESTSDVKDPVKRGLLFDDRINPIMTLKGQPIHVDGARTLKSTGPFPTVGESRGILFLERAISAALNPKRNRNNRPRLRNEIKMIVEEFMSRLTKAECFASTKDEDAWFFDIGDALNSAAEQAAGNVRSRLGVATTKPAEFIFVEFTPKSV